MYLLFFFLSFLFFCILYFLIYTLKKESIQPQVPLRLPCYDFVLVTKHNLVSFQQSPYKFLRFSIFNGEYKNNKNQIVIKGDSLCGYFDYTRFPERDGRWVQGSGTNSPRRADPRLLVIPASCSRIAENNLNTGEFYRFAPIHIIATFCAHHCNTCVAQFIRVMRTWRDPSLPPVYHRQ